MRLFQFLLQAGEVFHQLAFAFKGELERAQLLFQVGNFAHHSVAPLAAGRVCLLLQGLLFHLQLEDAAIQRVDLGGRAVQFDAAAAGGLVHQVDGFVGQEAVGDIAIGEHGSGNQRAILDAHTMMGFVAFLQAAQDADGILDRGLLDHDGLETAFKRGILFDMLAVLIKGGRADAVQFAARQHGLEHVGGIHRTLGCASADQGMQFIDEEDDAACRAGDFFEDGFQAFLEFAAKLGPCDQRAEVKHDNLLIFERLGNVATHDALRQPFHDGGFADARLADQDGVILRAAAEHLDNAANLFVAPDDGIEFALRGQFGQVAPIFLQAPGICLPGSGR